MMMIIILAILSDEVGVAMETLAFHRMSLFDSFSPKDANKQLPGGNQLWLVGWLVGWLGTV